jgi:PIN domain nuclease of toxin-antitoxin system
MLRVFDSSAVLAFLYNESGADQVRPDLPDGVISAVNAAEVLAVLVRNSVPLADARWALQRTGVTILDFSWEHAVKTAEVLSPQLRSRGISLGDRACMATALAMGAPAVTADRTWADLQVPGLQVDLIRD